MQYSVNQLAKLSGVTPRTLRYYDQIGLLKPARIDGNNYRVYGDEQVDTLQQILFYRELGVGLDEIKELLGNPSFDHEEALKNHLAELQERKKQIDLLIGNVRRTIQALRGEATMKDCEKFEGFKQRMIEENEWKYGREVRSRFGDAAVDASNTRIKGMTAGQYADLERLTGELNSTLAEAVKTGDPGGELAQKACALHREFLCFFWPEGTYSPEAHRAIAQSYVDDARFTAHYEKIAPGCAVFLRDAVNIYCGE